jgi:hypothetical protein
LRQASRAGRAVKRRRASIAEETRRDPRSRANSPRRRAARPCSIRVIVFTPFHPSVENARKEEGENPRAFNQIGTRPPGRWGNARRANTPAPQSKPVAQASRLVAQVAPSVALGLGVRIPAAGPAHLGLYSHSGRLRTRTSKNLLELLRAHRQTPANRPTRLPPTRRIRRPSRHQPSAADSNRASRATPSHRDRRATSPTTPNPTLAADNRSSPRPPIGGLLVRCGDAELTARRAPCEQLRARS